MEKVVSEVKYFEPEMCYDLEGIPKINLPQIKHLGNFLHINCQGHFITMDGKKESCPGHIF